MKRIQFTAACTLFMVMGFVFVADGDNSLPSQFQWTCGPPVAGSVEADGEEWLAIKDPTIVRYEGRWHLFCTVRGQERSHVIVYLSFADWDEAAKAPQRVLPNHAGFFCAPQVFYFAPQKKWCLICQASDESWEPPYQPAFATTSDIADPDSWSGLQPLGARQANGKTGLDFWIICDDEKAHLFFTTLNGRMWREETSLERFPHGWSEPELAIRGDIFEASHTYRLKGLSSYLTLVEAQSGHGWRYFKAYTAGNLDGEWHPLAADKENAFASMKNVRQTAEHWTDSISHGELLRAGFDQRLEVDPEDLIFLFQGVLEKDRKSKKYGQIPWRMGILEPKD